MVFPVPSITIESAKECPQIVNLLAEISAKLGAPITTKYGSFRHESGSWNFEQKGKTRIYVTELTLAGTTQTITLPLDAAFIKINRIDMSFNSSNARTFDIQLYSKLTASLYTLIRTVIAITTTSWYLSEMELKARPTRMTFNFSSYTAGDIVGIEVQIDD